MNSKRWIQGAALVGMVCASMTLGKPAVADTPGYHPHYGHALRNLEAADTLLLRSDEGAVWTDEQRAERQVQLAINDVRNAAIQDDKDVAYAPPPEVGERRGRLREINRLLRSALADLQQLEENGAAAGWQSRAMGHVNQALLDNQQALMDAHIPRAYWQD